MTAILDRLGISIDRVTSKVLDEGIGLFTNAINKLLDAIAAKRALAAVAGTAAMRSSRSRASSD